MYYIEFVEPKPGVTQEQFQQVVSASNERWARDHPDDELVLLIGRTWRLGPKPPYLAIWRIKDREHADALVDRVSGHRDNGGPPPVPRRGHHCRRRALRGHRDRGVVNARRPDIARRVVTIRRASRSGSAFSAA